SHLEDFASSLSMFDEIIIYKIYAAREENLFHINEDNLKEELQKLGKSSNVIKDFASIKEYLENNIHKNDIVITLGAGEITKLSEILTKEES
ncbi:MAG: UDP-N-acetylmuramate--L-alanine ligase, partial [Bacilli bacterium]|nr:UDP-N-acetylmuramate--L-alanine ligase [Bacilli bacterium]